MRKLDSIVNEVRESEEWEAVRMSIYSVALAHGKEIEKIELICKKIRRGKSIEVIAEEMEETVEEIAPVCEMAAAFAPEYNTEKITELWLRKNGSK